MCEVKWIVLKPFCGKGTLFIEIYFAIPVINNICVVHFPMKMTKNVKFLAFLTQLRFPTSIRISAWVSCYLSLFHIILIVNLIRHNVTKWLFLRYFGDNLQNLETDSIKCLCGGSSKPPYMVWMPKIYVSGPKTTFYLVT